MKKFASLLIMLFIPLMGCAADYEEGKQYSVVGNNVTAKPEVREFFSFYCPHCFRFEPFFAKIKKELPKHIKFVRNHVDFLGGAKQETQAMLTKALVVAQQLPEKEKLISAIFNYIQVQRATFTNEKDVRNLFVLNGVDGDKFDKLMKSFSVNSVAKQMRKKQDYYAKIGALTGVPTVIVNGKYRVNPKELDSKNIEQDYKNLLIYLSSLK
jgi:thiol:disulfide interchange protein DsbA